MLAVKMSTLKKDLLDNICDKTARRIVEFAEAECDLDTGRGTRILVGRVEEALKFCCDNRGVLINHKTITEAKKVARA